MKTFKLKSLSIVEAGTLAEERIPLYDGLIINQEDDKKRWIIEAFIDQKYKAILDGLKDEEQITLEVKITKDTNDPASFLTKISSINEIEERMSVIFVGQILDERKSKLEKTLARLIEQGYKDKQLLEEFKKTL